MVEMELVGISENMGGSDVWVWPAFRCIAQDCSRLFDSGGYMTISTAAQSTRRVGTSSALDGCRDVHLPRIQRRSRDLAPDQFHNLASDAIRGRSGGCGSIAGVTIKRQLLKRRSEAIAILRKDPVVPDHTRATLDRIEFIAVFSGSPTEYSRSVRKFTATYVKPMARMQPCTR